MSDRRRVTSWADKSVSQLIRAEFDAAAGNARWLASGHWSDCFVFHHEGGDAVVRIGRHGEDFRKDAVAARFTQPNLPVPAILGIGRADPEHEYAISEFVPGVPLEQAPNWPELVDAICDLFDALCHVDVTSLAGWGRWSSDGQGATTSWREFLLQVDQDPPDSRVHGWKELMTTSPASVAAFDHWYQLLAGLSEVEVPRSLVHNDLFNRNAHVAGTVIAGVFDWGNSVIGDHLYDLALLIFWQPWLKQVRDELVLAELRSRWIGTEKDTDFEPRIQACLLHIGLEHMAYHSYLRNFDEVALVARRIEVLMDRCW